MPDPEATFRALYEQLMSAAISYRQLGDSRDDMRAVGLAQGYGHAADQLLRAIETAFPSAKR